MLALSSPEPLLVTKRGLQMQHPVVRKFGKALLSGVALFCVMLALSSPVPQLVTNWGLQLQPTTLFPAHAQLRGVQCQLLTLAPSGAEVWLGIVVGVVPIVWQLAYATISMWWLLCGLGRAGR